LSPRSTSFPYTTLFRSLREMHFADVPRGYPITTRFGIRARNRFGSIGSKDRQTIIMVNRLFADPIVPTFVVDGTIVHELAHYARSEEHTSELQSRVDLV